MAENKRAGKLVVISGFSGVGKGTVVGRLLEDYDHYVLSVSMTTRKPRVGEVHGVNYYFVSNEEFEKMIRDGGLLEYAGYADHYYGTPRSFVEENMANGKDVILEIEVQGAMQIKKTFPDAVLIFITTPSAAEMAKRLIGRKTETEEQIDHRFGRAVEEAEHLARYEYIVVNDDLEDCVHEVNRIVETGEGGVRYDPEFKKKFLAELLEIIAERAEARRKRAAAKLNH
jgi:guanylate kinase